MSVLRKRDNDPRNADDFPLGSRAAATMLQASADGKGIARTATESSGVSEMEMPFCLRETPAVGKQSGINGRLAFAIAAAVIGSSFQHGYNTGVVNAPQKLIEEWIGSVLTERSPQGNVIEQREVTMIFSVFVAIFCVGGMLGGCATGYVADKFGRRGGLLLNTVLVVLSCILQGGAKAMDCYEMLIIGRFFIGINSGLNAGLAPMYIAEISPVQLRGATGTIYQLIITMSILLSQFLGTESMLGNEHGWPVLLGITVVPAIFLLVTLPFCPESPKYLLVSRDDETAAKRALIWLRGTSEVYDEMEEMKNEYENVRILPRVTIGELLLNPTLRIPLIISVVVMIGQQFSGINAVMFYSTKMFKMVGMQNENAQYATLAIGIVNLGMTVVSLILVEKAGRKTLLLLGFQGMCVISILFAVCLTFAERSTAISYLSIALVMVFVIMFAVGPGSIPWFLVTELFSQSARPVAISVAVAVNWTANFIVGLSFLPLQEIMKGYVFLIFVVFQGLFSIFIRFKVPETKNKTVDEISAMFRQRSYK
ncbi:UNVERIFIED_CONTAM: hypothetical protein PYX00_004830 [Menopon gallinae]|uniref:Major facilitator superfamily (MFS) profile domain-containing protein n=1 Tax=Menopon gallinae TaxID=328185 RepID=A0AAW2I7C8_9NEOP